MKKVLHCDLHVHTNYSYDNPPQNTMEAYAQKAVECGVDVVCFTDHIECCHVNTLDDFPFDQRLKEFERVKKQFQGKVKLLQGYEMGSPHRHPKELAFLRSFCPDMIIGSVHYPCYYHDIVGRISPADYEKLYNQEVRAMVERGGFDLLGHADMPKKYHANYVADNEYLQKTLEICAKNGIIPEMNTSCMRKTDKPRIVDESMISSQMTRYYASVGGKFVAINSDSHAVNTLGADFEKTYRQIEDAVKLCYFEKGKLVCID